MQTIEIAVGPQIFELRSEESPEHVAQVEKLVRERLATLRQKHPQLATAKLAILLAFELAGELLQDREKARAFQQAVLVRTETLLEQL